MIKQYSLAHLTVMTCAPPEITYIAARSGYDFVGLRLIPVGVPGERFYLPKNKVMVRKTKAALNETGIKVLDLELARIVDDVVPTSYVSAMEVAAELGAKHVISSAWTTQRNDLNFIIDSFAEICDLAKPFGLTVNLEFPSFSRLKNLQEAIDIVRIANRPNSGILIDTLYIHFSRIDLGELETLPHEWLNFVHICDSPEEIPITRDGMIHVARNERLYFGEGCIDFPTILDRLPSMPYSIELPNIKQVKEFGCEVHARRCLETAKQHLKNVTGREPA